MRLTTPRSSRQDTPPATDDLHPGYRARRQAARLSGLSRSDLVPWHIAAFAATHHFVAYWSNNGQSFAQKLNRCAAIDPSATLAVHCGNTFDAGFSPYRSTRLSR
jgi:hypothetical protein